VPNAALSSFSWPGSRGLSTRYGTRCMNRPTPRRAVLSDFRHLSGLKEGSRQLALFEGSRTPLNQSCLFWPIQAADRAADHHQDPLVLWSLVLAPLQNRHPSTLGNAGLVFTTHHIPSKFPKSTPPARLLSGGSALVTRCSLRGKGKFA